MEAVRANTGGMELKLKEPCSHAWPGEILEIYNLNTDKHIHLPLFKGPF